MPLDLQASQPVRTGLFDLEGLSEKPEEVRNLRQIGSKSFYKEGESWVDSVASKEQSPGDQVQRFSKTYFDLAAKHGERARACIETGRSDCCRPRR